MLNTRSSRSRRVRFACLPLVTLLLGGGIAPPLAAQESYLYWDADGDSSSATGGTGTWTDATGWRIGSTTGALTGLQNDTTAIAVFQGTDGTVTLDSGLNPTIGGLSSNGINHVIALNGNTLTVSSSYVSTYYGQITGSGALYKDGSGHLTLSNANSYEGETTINAGSLTVNRSNALGATTAGTTVNSGAFLNINGGITIGAEAVTLNGGYFESQYGDNTFYGDISGSGTVTLHTGSLNLVGDATHTGGTDIYSGTLQIGNLGDTGWITGNISNDGALVFANGHATERNFTGIISGSGTVTQAGSGELTLSGANSYEGETTVNSGNLVVAHDTALGATTAGTTVNSYTYLRLVDGVNVGAEAVTLNGGFFHNQSGDNTFAGSLTGSGGLWVEAGSLTLTGDAAHTAGALPAGTYISGTLQIGNGGSTGSIAGDITNEGALIFNSSTDQTFAGDISGAGTLTQAGTNVLTLSGNHTVTGGTAVNAGRLRLTGSAANSAFTINSGGTLSGTGTLGDLTLNDGGILSPGNSPGTLSAGDTVWNGGGEFVFEINDATGIVGTSWDLLDLTGSLTINATSGTPFSLNLDTLTAGNVAGAMDNFDANTNYSWTFVSTTGGITFGNGASIGGSFSLDTSGFANATNGSFAIALANGGNDLALTYTSLSAVPEPSTYALLLGMLILGYVSYQRRRR